LEGWDYNIDRGKVLDVPIIEVSPFVYEFEFIDKFKIGDGIIYIGEIRNIQIDSSFKKIEYGEIDLMDFKPVIYAPGKYYSLMRSLGKVGLSRGKSAPKNAEKVRFVWLSKLNIDR
jgi:flavin reductase (DIM6/NTAB) family NADH-FMN oxidoreductase RutF